MSRLFATAGAKLHIGAAKEFAGTDLVAADFTTGSPTWTEVGGTTNLGSSGDSTDLITSAHIGENRIRKMKGVRNAGSMQIIADIDYADAGQIALIAAEKSDDTFAFRITFDDAPAGGTPSYRYFVALVMSAVEQLDEANNTMKLATTLEIDSNIVRVVAAEAP